MKQIKLTISYRKEGVKMNIKCGREEFALTEKDIIMYNGACYQLITRKIIKGWSTTSPVLAKAKAVKLIKDGKLKETIIENPPYKSEGLVYYSI
jgi:hypothetical protein